MGIYEFKADDAYRFAVSQGTKVKTIGNKEIQFLRCPYCHNGNGNDRYTFAINMTTGAFNCKRASCGAKGNMITLAQDFGFTLDNYTDAYLHRGERKYKTLPQRKPEPADRAVSYLAGRGIPEEIAKQYNITISNKDESVMCFPFYDEDDVLQFVKYRNLDFKPGDKGNKEWCESSCKPILFGMNHCKSEYGALVITEGQIDSLSVAAAGIPNAVSVPNGKNGFTWIPQCWDFLQDYKEIIVFGDCERGEITLLDEIARRFRGNKVVRHVRIEDYKGHKDANEILQAEGAAAIVTAIEQAEIIENPKIIRVSDIQRINMESVGGIKTGFAGIDEKIEKLYFGQLVLLTGERGHGKSTLGMQLITRAIDAGISVMAYSGELTGWQFREWIERQFAGKKYINVMRREDEAAHPSVNAEIVPKMTDWYGDKLFLYDNCDSEVDTNESLLSTLESSIVQYGCKMILVDNLMTALNDDLSADIYRQQTAFVRNLAKLAKQHEVLIVLIAHPRKVSEKHEFDNDDVSGSANITNLCDVVLQYAKPKGQPKDSPERVLRITKNRNNGRVDYEGIMLYFEDVSKRISAATGIFDWAYGWETEADKFIPADDLDDIPF